ncbi:MAG TPA: acylphosphatase [Actinomycetota bacterium]|jgi:acylphosphatase|nr:acylphosphatase [Actinomycetota bacterium]
MRRVRVRLSGRVQGVFFRASCAERADDLGLGGWIRNVPGGGVEAVFEGTESAVAQMVSWCREGPPLARVDRIDVVDEAPAGEAGFHIS